jgi:hypothetical protein
MTAWTPPISWPTGLDVTEAILNQQVRDNFLNLDERLDVIEALANPIHAAIFNVVPDGVQVDTVVGIKYIPVPAFADGMNLITATAFTIVAGVTGATTIQVRNITKYPANDALSTAMSIASGATVSTGGAIDAARDDVSTNDMLKAYVTAQSTTKPYGLVIVLQFQAP